MATTDNGWSASRTLDTRPLVVAGETFSPGIRDNDDVYTLLQYVAEQMNERVERVWAPGWHEQDDWGFSYRDNKNDPNNLSRHSGGIAIDYNATRHPNGVATSKTFTNRQIEEVHRILAETEHVVRWGGDYSGTPDAMHFEIDEPPGSAKLARVADKIRNNQEDAEMALTKETKDYFDRQFGALKRANKNQWKREREMRQTLNQIARDVKDDATKEQVRKVMALMDEGTEEEGGN